MRRRDLALNAGIGLAVVAALALLIYSPVFVAWWNREEQVVSSTYEKHHLGYDRELYIEANYFVGAFPAVYGRMLVYHASLNGWMYLGSFGEASRAIYQFAPDTHEVRANMIEREKRRRTDQPSGNAPAETHP